MSESPAPWEFDLQSATTFRSGHGGGGRGRGGYPRDSSDGGVPGQPQRELVPWEDPREYARQPKFNRNVSGFQGAPGPRYPERGGASQRPHTYSSPVSGPFIPRQYSDYMGQAPVSRHLREQRDRDYHGQPHEQEQQHGQTPPQVPSSSPALSKKTTVDPSAAPWHPREPSTLARAAPNGPVAPIVAAGGLAGAAAAGVMAELTEQLKITTQAETDGAPTFSVMQWNILAHGLDNPTDFPKATTFALNFQNYRCPFILDAIQCMSPDVVCLEELNHSEHFAKKLPDYRMVFVPKLDSPCLPSYPPDGCAMFLRRDRWEILDIDIYYYRRKATKQGEDEADFPLENQNAILVKLLCKVTLKAVLVAMTHLKAKAGFEFVRYHQSVSLLRRIKSAAVHRGAPIPVVLCGDFNSDVKERVVYEAIYCDPELHFSSCFNKFTQMQEFGRVVHHHDDPDYISAGGAPIGSQPRQDLDSYAAGEPEYTTWKFRSASDASGNKKQTIDYIFATLLADKALPPLELFNPSLLSPSASEAGASSAAHADAANRGAGLRLVNCMPLMGEVITGPLGLPSEEFPSDHLFLLAEFLLL